MRRRSPSEQGPLSARATNFLTLAFVLGSSLRRASRGFVCHKVWNKQYTLDEDLVTEQAECYEFLEVVPRYVLVKA